MTEFSEWFLKRSLELQFREGHRITVVELAEILNVSQPTVTAWQNGKRQPTGDNIDKIAGLFGPEVYDLVGRQRPDPGLKYITSNWHKLSEEFKFQIQEQAAKDLYEQGIINDKPPLPSTST